MTCFRIKCRTASSFQCDAPRTVTFPTFDKPLRVVPVKSIFGQNFIDLRGDDYPDAKAAEREAARLAQLLLLAGAKRGYGANLSGGAIRFSDVLKDGYRENTAKSLVEDRVGITVYEPPADIMGFHAQGSVLEQVDELSSYVAEVIDSKLPLTERQRIALELLNDTYFDPATDTAFVTSITAVEALCPEKVPSKFFQSLVAKLIFIVKILNKAARALGRSDWLSDTEELEKNLEGLKTRKSVRQGYMTKLRELLGREIAKEFDNLYKDRSAFVHDGRGRGSFIVKAPRARQIALDLLFAEVSR